MECTRFLVSVCFLRGFNKVKVHESQKNICFDKQIYCFTNVHTQKLYFDTCTKTFCNIMLITVLFLIYFYQNFNLAYFKK